MLNWAITFFVVALIAALLGFSGVANISAEIGWILGILGVVVLAIALISRGRASTPLP